MIVLLRLGRRAPFAIPFDHLRDWVRATEPADAVAALIRLAALVAAGWLLLTTLLYFVARAVTLPRGLRAVEWATLPAVRRFVDRAVVVVAMGAFMAPAGVATVDVRDGHGGSNAPTSTTRSPTSATMPTSTAPASVSSRRRPTLVGTGDERRGRARRQPLDDRGRASRRDHEPPARRTRRRRDRALLGRGVRRQPCRACDPATSISSFPAR